MSDHQHAKADARLRAATLTRGSTGRETDVDDSYSHAVRAKFLRVDDIDEGDEDDHGDTVLIRPHRSRHSERLASGTLATQRDPRPLDDEHVVASAGSPVGDKIATSAGIAELCQYIQKLETEKRDLLDQVQFLRDQDATHKVNLSAASRRIDKLEAMLQQASHASDSQQHGQLQIEAAIATERDKTVAMADRLERMQRKYDDAERARQHAVFKLSELQTTMAEATTNRLLTPPHARLQQQPQQHARAGTPLGTRSSDAVDPTTGSNERIEKFKREIELLRQKLELREEQAHEKQKLAVELALRSADLEHSAALEKVKLECEIQLSEWRHEEAVRAKEVEAAMEEDRYSIRLEMKHGMQRAQIEQRVYYLQAQAALAQTPSSSSSSSSLRADVETDDVPFSAMDEVLVRLQLELLRTRRFAALKKLLQIRQTVVERSVRRALFKWKTVATQTTLLRRQAVLHMHRLATHLAKQDVRSSFQRWRLHTQQRTAETQRQRVVACWNRMVAVERMVHVLQQRRVKQMAGSFHRWRLQPSTREAYVTSGSVAKPTTSAVSPGSSREVAAVSVEPVVGVGGVELQDEIRKLHEQLASSKSEAWRYKRQLLKQFL